LTQLSFDLLVYIKNCFATVDVDSKNDGNNNNNNNDDNTESDHTAEQDDDEEEEDDDEEESEDQDSDGDDSDFSGHYIVVCGFDSKHSLMFYKNPWSGVCGEWLRVSIVCCVEFC
jgi:hypothetical protein